MSGEWRNEGHFMRNGSEHLKTLLTYTMPKYWKHESKMSRIPQLWNIPGVALLFLPSVMLRINEESSRNFPQWLLSGTLWNWRKCHLKFQHSGKRQDRRSMSSRPSQWAYLKQRGWEWRRDLPKQMVCLLAHLKNALVPAQKKQICFWFLTLVSKCCQEKNLRNSSAYTTHTRQLEKGLHFIPGSMSKTGWGLFPAWTALKGAEAHAWNGSWPRSCYLA